MNPSWSCVQLAELLQRASESLHDAARVLDLVDGAAIADFDGTLSHDDVEALKISLTSLAEFSERMQLLSDALPDGEIRLEGERVRDGAAAALADGILEPRRALLAAGALDVPAGFSALAAGLRLTESHTAWAAVTVAEMLSRFQGVDAAIVRDVLDDAQLPTSATFEDVDAEGALQLAAALASRGSFASRG